MWAPTLQNYVGMNELKCLACASLDAAMPEHCRIPVIPYYLHCKHPLPYFVGSLPGLVVSRLEKVPDSILAIVTTKLALLSKMVQSIFCSREFQMRIQLIKCSLVVHIIKLSKSIFHIPVVPV